MSAINDDAIDSEITDIFVEEATEVLENIDQQLPIWRNRLTDQGALTEIRRGFHTLKGSGRMVKALDLGELAWKIENMLNRVINGTISASEPMVKLVAATRNVMPTLLDAFKHQRPVGMEAELETLMAHADALATGRPPRAAPRPAPAPAPTATATPAAAGDTRGLQFKIETLDRRLERYAQRADEALHRAEMALQQVRRLATAQRKSAETDAQETQVDRAEVTEISDRVQMLSHELLQMRHLAKGLEQQQGLQPHARELQHLIDRRVGDKLATVEQWKADLQDQLDESRLAASSARRLAVTAVILSLLIAGAAGMVFSASGLG